MSEPPVEARSDPGADPEEGTSDAGARPVGLADAKSSARRKTPTPGEDRSDPTPAIPLRPPREGEPRVEIARPPGLTQMTTSARQRLELVLEHDEDEGPPRVSKPPALDPTSPPKLAAGQLALGPAELAVVRSLGRWVALSGLMTLSVGALTGLSYFTGEGKVAHVVVGILASALSIWLLGAARGFLRVAARKPRPRQNLVNALGLLRSALLLKALLVFAAMALGCFTFSLAASFLFLL